MYQKHMNKGCYAKITPWSALCDANCSFACADSDALRLLLPVLACAFQFEPGRIVALTAAVAGRSLRRTQCPCVRIHDMGCDTCTASTGTTRTYGRYPHSYL